MTSEPTTPPLTVRFARRPNRGVLLGFSGPRVAALGAAGLVATLAVFAAGAAGLALAALLWAPLTAAALVRVSGRPAVEWAGTALDYQTRRATGQHQYRARPDRRRPAGTLALPGDAASLRVHLDAPTGAAMIHDPHRRTLTAAVTVTHPAFALLDDTDRAGRVARWGRTLAALAGSGTCAAIQVLEATVPDPATGQHAWWTSHGHPEVGWAAEQYQTLLDRVSLGSSTHRSTISLALDLRAANRAIRAAGGGVHGAAELLRADMTSLTDSLRTAGLRPGAWLDPTGLAVALRHAYDPAATPDPAVATLEHAGPMAINERWDRLRHDSAWTQVLWIVEWPRIAVPVDFLHPLLFAPGIRRSFALYARPLPTDEALRRIRKDRTAAVADSTQKARVGQLADLSDAQEYEDLLARERSVIAGHTDVELTGLVAVTAPTPDTLDAAIATITRAAAQACCELRPVYGHQMQAFTAAALPLARHTL